MQIPTKTVRSLARIGLLGSALGVTAFYLVLFWRDNAAPPVSLAGFRIGDGYGFQYHMDRCRWNDKKVAVTGWIARQGHGADRRSVRVLVVDHADGSAYALKTSLQQRDDVRKLLNRRLGDRIDYRYAGFTASLSLQTAGKDFQQGQLYVAYEDADLRVLLPLPCRAQRP